MKKLLFLFLFIGILSCDKPTPKEQPKPEPKPAKQKMVVETKPAIEEVVDNTLVKLQRKPCSGDCPVFDVTISKDSTLRYHGKKFTNIQGVRTIKLTGRQFDKITKLLENSDFSSLKNRYTKSGTKDFSESVITHQGKKVTVRLWKDAPKKLTAIYVFLEDILYDKKYLE